jgi:hypothetical protein
MLVRSQYVVHCNKTYRPKKIIFKVLYFQLNVIIFKKKALAILSMPQKHPNFLLNVQSLWHLPLINKALSLTADPHLHKQY